MFICSEHRRAKVKRPKSEQMSAIGPRTMASGFVERFYGTVLDEFLRVKTR